MVRVGHVDVLDPGEQGFGIGGAVARAGEAREDAFAHRVPQQPQALNQGRGLAEQWTGGRGRREGVGLADTEVGRPHRRDDLVRHAVPADVAEGGG